jgi:hypothetical protein
MATSKLALSRPFGKARTQLFTRKTFKMLMHSPTTKVGSYSFHLVLQYSIVSLDVHKGIYSIFQYNLITHVTTTLVDASPGGASRPELSRDGRTLAFVRRVRDKQALVLKYVGNHLSSARFSTFLF